MKYDGKEVDLPPDLEEVRGEEEGRRSSREMSLAIVMFHNCCSSSRSICGYNATSRS